MECWVEVPEGATSCPSCAADLEALDRTDFGEKLARALGHPSPDIVRRAVEILGRRRSVEAVPALLARFRRGVDPYLGAEIVTALARIGGAEARAALNDWSRSNSLLIRRAAQEGLDALDREAPVAERVNEVGEE
jgi:HEAT repeat protein